MQKCLDKDFGGWYLILKVTETDTKRKGGYGMFDELAFRERMTEMGVTISDIAKTLGVNESTVFRKISANGRFTRDEIMKLCKLLKIKTRKDLNRIFFAK